MKKLLQNIIGITLSIGLGVLIIWWSVSKLDSQQKLDIKNAIVNADYFWIIIAFIIGVLSHVSRAYRWKYLLEPLGYKPKFMNSFFTVFIGYLINLLIPRGGEVARASFMSKYEKIPFEKVFGTIVAERVVDFIMLLLITFLALFYQFDFIGHLLLSKIPKNPMLLLAVFIVLILLGVGTYIFIKRSQNKWILKIRKFISGLIDGVISIWKMKNRTAFILHSIFIWFAYLLTFYVVSLSIEATSHLSLGAVLSGFVGGSLGTTTNGGLGTFPFAVQQVFILYNIDSNMAYAYGWLMWILQTLMVILIGLISIIAIPFYNKKFLK